MTDQQHPITPPPELVQQWAQLPDDWNTVAFHIALWGADQELEACRHWLEVNGAPRKFIDGLLDARRPEPPISKEQALDYLVAAYEKGYLSTAHYKNIRRALEQLDD